MGWSNFCIIPKLTLIIEVSRRDGQHLSLYMEEALDKLFEDTNDLEEDPSQKPIQDLTVEDYAILDKAYNIYSNLYGMGYSQLLFYWLESRNMFFEVVSEHEINLSEYDEKGFTIMRF